MKNTENTRVTIKIFSIVPFPPFCYFLFQKKSYIKIVSRILPPRKSNPRLELGFGLEFGLEVGLGNNFSLEQWPWNSWKYRFFLVLAETTYV